MYDHCVYYMFLSHNSLQFPRLCEFQRANYSYSLSLADTNSSPEAASDTKTYTGGDDRRLEGQLLGLKLEIGPVYRARVMAELTESGEVFGDSEICIGPGKVHVLSVRYTAIISHLR